MPKPHGNLQQDPRSAASGGNRAAGYFVHTKRTQGRTMRRTAVILAALALTFARADAQTNAPAQQTEAAAPISVAPANAAEGDWVLAPKDYANTRFSTLNQITPQNVKDLKVAWTFSTGVNRGQEAAPIIAEQTMFVVTPYPNILYALDLTKPGAPLKWKYEPKPSSASQGVACCDV